MKKLNAYYSGISQSLKEKKKKKEEGPMKQRPLPVQNNT